MVDEIICGQCPAVYRPEQIDAYRGTDKISTLALLQRKRQSGRPSKGGGSTARQFFRRAAGLRAEPRPAPGPNLEGIDRLRDYTFRCPNGHVVDGNSGDQFGLAVLGASGASKSHMLPAIVRELETMSALRKLGVKLRPALYANPKLAEDMIEVYRLGRRLPPTPAGEMLGPFGYKLNTGRRERNGAEPDYSLLLFDIAGEDLGAIARIVEAAPYILLCRALMVLIDPVDFLPTAFKAAPMSDREKLDAASDVRAGIRVIAETLGEVWEVESSRELSIPVCFAISKADSVEWPSDFDWAAQTRQVIDATSGGMDLSECLQAYSDATRNALEDLGGELVIDEIEECFSPDTIRFVAASATSTMPTDAPDANGREWVDEPEPNGVALGILHLLDLAGAGPRPAAVPVDA